MDLRAQKLPRRAFTLVELLVVIAIVAILATLLLPVLSQAHARAKNAACKNSLRQVGLALEQYTQTYNAYPPQEIWRPTTLIGWDQLIGVYFGRPVVPFDMTVGPNPPVAPFLCPVYSAGIRNLPFDPFTPTYWYNRWGTISYSGMINGVISRPLGVGAESFRTDDDGNVINPDVWINLTVRDSDVVAPSEMIALGDPFSRSECQSITVIAVSMVVLFLFPRAGRIRTTIH